MHILYSFSYIKVTYILRYPHGFITSKLFAQSLLLSSQEYRNAGLVQNKNIRVAKYLVPVIVASVLLNVPKFVETSVGYDEYTGEVSRSLVI